MGKERSESNYTILKIVFQIGHINRYIKRWCSPSLVIKEIQIKMTRYFNRSIKKKPQQIPM